MNPILQSSFGGIRNGEHTAVHVPDAMGYPKRQIG
jgi:hypothetical protein